MLNVWIPLTSNLHSTLLIIILDNLLPFIFKVDTLGKLRYLDQCIMDCKKYFKIDCNKKYAICDLTWTGFYGTLTAV